MNTEFNIGDLVQSRMTRNIGIVQRVCLSRSMIATYTVTVLWANGNTDSLNSGYLMRLSCK